MLKWHATVTVIWLWCLFFLISQGAFAQNWVCSEDIDLDGDIDASTETASCSPFGEPEELFCSLNADSCIPTAPEECPVVGLPCSGGFCETPANCAHEFLDLWGVRVLVSTCPSAAAGGGIFIDDPAGCNAVCTEPTACTVGVGVTYNCPSNPSAGCFLNGAAGYQCSTNECYDLDATPPTDTDIPTDMLVNDGSTDAAGNCTALTYIFSGRPMDCKKAGVSTAFKNCCKETDTIYNDSVGTRAETQLASAAVTGTFTAMTAAYGAYSTAIAGGATTAAAADVAASAATDAFIGAFDPTTLAISVAIALITEYLLSGCEQTDLETAALRSSGYCVEVGEYCAKEWLGGCVQKAKSNCCFNSKLARIIQEQGRPQLQEFAALAPDYFGEPEAPTCDGFTPLQFQSLDFSRIDLTEYYDDITTDALPEIQERIEEGFNDYYEATGGG